ncbi:hypothetical protein ASF28_08825 [Methylobacterium sp. Leaf99]|nr:hypothetical protein ASF28_08825 [Methylobacterium sp. Leaf99]
MSQSGALTDAQIFSTISNSREADQVADPVIRFYQAAFGRVPDQAGLQNAENFVRALGPSAATYQNLSNMFAQSQEFTNRFGTGTAVDAAYVQALYSTILGRAASSGEVDGYVNSAGITRGSALYLVSQSQEAISVSDAAVNGFQLNAAQGQAVYTGSIYTAANGQPNTPGTNGQTVTFTTGIDTLNGGAGNDTFIGTSSATNPTLSLGDTVNGGAGTDTLRIVSNLGNAIPSIATTSVEIYEINSTAADSLAISNQTTGLTAVNFVGGGNNSFALTNFNNAASIGLSNTGEQITVTANNVGGTNDTQAVTLSNVQASATAASPSTASLTEDGIETFAVTTSGAASNLLSLNSNSLKTITVAGSGNLAIATALADSVTTVDASASAGSVNITAGNNATTFKFTGGAGNDTINLGTDVLGTTGFVNGGAGNDTLVLNASNQLTTTLGAQYTNLETLKLAGGTTFNLDQIAGITKLVASADLLNVSNLAVGSTVTVDSNVATSLTVGVKNAATPGTADTLSLTLDNVTDFTNTSVASFSAAGVETLNIASTGAATGGNNANSVGSLANSTGLRTVNITGDSGFTLTTGVASAEAYNASGLTGKFSIDAHLQTIATAITGGSGNDVLIGGTGADIIVGGAGNDTIVGNTGNAVLQVIARPEIQSIAIATGSVDNTQAVTVTIDGIATTYTNASGGTVTGAALTAALVTTLNGNATFSNAYTAAVDATTNTTLTLTQKAGSFSDVAPATVAGSGISVADGVTVSTTQDGRQAVAAAPYTAAAGPAADVLTGGAGNDTFVHVNNSSSTTVVPSITDLNLGTAAATGGVDILSFQQAGGTGVAGAGVTVVTLAAAQQTAATQAASLTDAVNGLLANAGAANAAGSVVQFTYGTDTYILHSGDTANQTFQTTDHLVKVTGLTGILNASDVVLFAGA